MLYWVVLLLGGLLTPAVAFGATVNAASCALADVQSAVNTAVAGDTVQLPACTQVGWTSTVTITKALTLQGTGAGTTIIRRSNVAAGFLSNVMFLVSGVTGFTMTGMTIDGTYDTNPDTHQDTGLHLLNSVDFRVHHMTFQNLAQAIAVQGNPMVVRGLIDHNTFIDNWYVTANEALGYGIHVIGNSTWPALALGTAQNTFIEDNTFVRGRHMVASNNGARYVFRHNTITDDRLTSNLVQYIDAHGKVVSWPEGTRQYEIYENTITTSATQRCGPCPRGGDGVIFNNVMTPMAAGGVPSDIYLMNDAGCSGAWPTADQIQDLYIWGNTHHDASPAVIRVVSGCSSYIQAGRDYFTVPRPGYTAYVYPHPGQGGLAPPPDLSSGLEMHLKFDEGATATAQDSTANNHDGTLGAGATWGLAQMGASAVVLDGTASGIVTVTGELTAPPALTLAAWVKPAAFPTADAEIISLGDHAALRVTPTNVIGFYYTGSSNWVTLSVSSAVSTGAWTHLAYTVQAGAQRLYRNGVLIGSGNSGAPPSYVGLGANTILGGHANGQANHRFQGTIDDVRVYTRALTATDIAGLAALEDPPPLAIQITTPTTDPSYSTSSALLANVGGVATDPAGGVTGITWQCPTCVTTNAAANCTPSCGVSATEVNWNIPAIQFPATAAMHLLTVTATNGVTSRSDTLTITYAPVVAGACTHYASPSGTGNGLSPGSPFRVIDFWAVATPGKVLCLLPGLGTYTGGNSMIQPPSGLAGTSSQPITIRAQNDGSVQIDGQNSRNPVVLGTTNQWFVIEGFNANNGLTSVFEFLGGNNRGRRLIGWSATPGVSTSTIFMVKGANTTIEDCAAWGDNVRALFHGSGTTSAPGTAFRRCWGRWNDHPLGTTAPGVVALPGVNQVIENVIGTIDQTGE